MVLNQSHLKNQHASRQQRKIRRLKKEAKHQYKIALKDGDMTKAANLKKDFLKLVRLHNKVRKLELKLQKKLTSKATIPTKTLPICKTIA